MIIVEVNFDNRFDFETALGDWAVRSAEAIEAEIGREFRAPKTGRLYGSHRASAKGEAPAIKLGKLLQSFRVEPFDGFGAKLFTEVGYAGILEDDLDRPFSQPAIDAKIDEIAEDALERIENLL